MAKSFTAISNDIANALRLNTLSKEAPHVIEMNKLYESLEKLLKKPTTDIIHSEATLDEYYNKLEKLRNMLNSLRKKEIIQAENLEDSLSNSNNSTASEDISNQLQSPTKAATTTMAKSINSQLFQTPMDSSSTISKSPDSNIPASPKTSSTPISSSNKISPEKKRLLNALQSTDYLFDFNNKEKNVSMKGKKYEMSEFNSLYSKLRDGDSSLNKNTVFSIAEKEMFNNIKNTLANHPDVDKIINDLPGLKAYIIDQSPKATTRNRARKKSNLQNALISTNSPVTAKARRGGRPAQNKLTKTSGGGREKKPSGSIKINFRSWEDFLKFVFIFPCEFKKTIFTKNNT
jgi:hypothetical protein